jgi:8-oxo-dGTP pyrophosphatase MutT (NUDIX family)
VNRFESVGAEVAWDGKFLRAGIERFRYEDGAEVKRERVWHSGAVGVLALDADHVWLTRQPREVAGVGDSLEIPAGKRDVPGESPLETGKRELAEEIGKLAASWEEIVSFYTSPGFSDERVWLYRAADLSDSGPAELDEEERIEVVPWPLDRLADAIKECEDSKTLIALLWLLAERSR